MSTHNLKGLVTDALIHATVKADAMFEKNEIDGYDNWLAIIERIHQLGSNAPAAVH